MKHRQQVVGRCQCQGVQRPKAQVAGVHVGVGDEPAEPPKVIDALHVALREQARRDEAARENNPVGRAFTEERRVQRGQAAQAAAAEKTVAIKTLPLDESAASVHDDPAARFFHVRQRGGTSVACQL